MRGLHFSVRGGSLMDMLQEFRGCIQLSAALTSFQWMLPDDFVSNSDRS